MIMLAIFGFVPLIIWLGLAFAHHGFWRFRERDDRNMPKAPESWPSVTAVVPARDEAEGIVATLQSLLDQDYTGHFHVILVDDQSTDGTADLARKLEDPRIEIIEGEDHPKGWTGKLYAQKQGIDAATTWRTPDYLWFTDADIVHAPDTLRSLVSRAEDGNLVLTTLMAKLRCKSLAEKLFVPAFVFFFSMLYPFGAVNNRRSKIAGAAGGCMLVNATALQNAGGIERIRTEIIDDCAMGRLMKSQGPVWLGLTNRSVSVRPYPDMAEIHHMVSRTAYAQLHYNPLALFGTLIGLALMFVAPVADVFLGGLYTLCGVASWIIMALIFQPMLKFYGRSPLWGIALPLIGLIYGLFTFDSAFQHWMGRGGMWKGRAQAIDNPVTK